MVAGRAGAGAAIGALAGAWRDTAGMYPRRVQKLHMEVRDSLSQVCASVFYQVVQQCRQ